MYGVLSPVVTPFDADLRPDGPRFVRHCQWLLSQDVGLAVFGTNSEGNSLTTGEKIALLDTLVGAGLPPRRLVPATAARRGGAGRAARPRPGPPPRCPPTPLRSAAVAC